MVCIRHLFNNISINKNKVINIPSISIYVNDEMYKYLMDKGTTPSKAGKNIIESEYNRQKETENDT